MALTPQQKDAISIRDKTLLVSAAAGSGKTKVLTERIILSLLGKRLPDEEAEGENQPNDAPFADLSRLLIVTFTRAAAAELKSRIAAAPNKALAENPDNEQLSAQLFLLGSAQISTIDSFFQKAIKANFEKADVPATFRIADDSELLPIKQELIETLIEEFYHKHDYGSTDGTAIRRIEKNAFAQALDHLISNRSDGKLCELLLDFYNCFSNDPTGIARLEECARQLSLDADRDVFSTAWGKELLAYVEGMLQGHLRRLRELSAYLDECPEDRAQYGGVVGDDLALCASIWEAIEDADYDKLRARTEKPVFTKIPSKKGDLTTQIRAYRAMRDSFKADINSIGELLCFDREEIALQCKECDATFRMLYELFAEYEVRLQKEKRERGAYEFNDIRQKLYELLNDKNGNPTPFANELAAQYDAVYIDEYQDVDGIQDSIFARVGGDHRFMVGDIKQSIYGFRGGDPSIFSKYRRELPLYDRDDPQATADEKGICVFMSSNFRCNEPVIRFANKVCSFLFSACEESINYRDEDNLVFKKGMPQVLPEGHPAPVQVEVFEPKPRGFASEREDGDDLGDGEVRWVANEIARLLREEYAEAPHDKSNPSPTPEPLIPSDIAILTRSHKQNKRFADALAAIGIPVATAAQNDVLNAPILTAVINLLRVIDNPYRDLPLTEFLLSELGGFTLSEITEIKEGFAAPGALYDALMHAGKSSARVGQLLEELELWRRRASVQPADKFLRLLYADERLAPHASSPALLFLYDQARICQRTAFCGIYGFLSHLSKLLGDKKLSADGFKKAESAVQIMTVHHSKGLEFPVVFYAGTGASFNREDLKKTLLYHRDVGVAAKLYNRESGALEESAIHAALKLRIRAEQTEEEIRALYVALTRASERLYVTGTLRGAYESACADVEAIRYGDRHAILKTSNALKWILAALQKNPEGAPFVVTPHPYGSVEAPGVARENREQTPGLPLPTDPRAQFYADLVKRKEVLAYPDAHLAGLPSKLAASKLHRDILDTLDVEEDSARAVKAQCELLRTRPSFAALCGESSQASATDVGTAMHAFLEFCDFGALRRHGAKAECDRLVNDGFLSKETSALLHTDRLDALCKSDLMELVLDATEIRREQKFSMLLPMSELTQNAERAKQLANERVFVQGSIDLLLFMPDGRRILVDYKTDSLSKEEAADPARLQARFQKHHADQLSCYARAIRQLFGKAPDEVLIYSVPLGATVKIDVSL